MLQASRPLTTQSIEETAMAVANFNTIKLCSAEGCDREADSRSLCLKHYKRGLKNGSIIPFKPVYPKTCIADGCGKDSKKKGYCEAHYRRMHKFGRIHNIRQAPGSLVPTGDGYLTKRINGERKLYHVLIAERAMGKALPVGAEVHHINEKRSDNRPDNLVICPDRDYHMMLHARQRASDSCGNANWKRCGYCKNYDEPSMMTGRSSRGEPMKIFYHKSCAAKYARERKRIRKSKQH